MSDLRSLIKDVVAGNSFRVIREIRNLPVGESLLLAWFTVKNRREDDDEAAVFQKTLRISETDDGQILDDGSYDRIGLISIKLKPTDTIKLKQNTMYWFDLKLLTASGSQYTPELGNIIVVDPVTLAGIGSNYLVISSGGVGIFSDSPVIQIGIIL